MSTNGKVRQREVAIVALLASPDIQTAALASGVSVRTMYRFLNDERFRGDYNEAKRRMLDGAINKLRASASAAVDVLVTIAKDVGSPQSARVSAARTILEMALRAGAIEDIEERLAELEGNTIEGTMQGDGWRGANS